jgi:DNA-directed RNA polymerase specialized sigma subunit
VNIRLLDFAKRHDEWIKIAVYIGADQEFAKEIVQQMYLKLGEIEVKEGSLNKLINYAGGINTVYVFKVIQSIYFGNFKNKDLAILEEIEYEIQDSNEEEEMYDILIRKIKVIISSFDEYERMLLELYFVHDKSLRDIHKSTGIGVHAIFNTIKNAKQKIKRQTEQEYKNYESSRNGRKTSIRFRGFNCSTDEDY